MDRWVGQRKAREKEKGERQKNVYKRDGRLVYFLCPCCTQIPCICTSAYLVKPPGLFYLKEQPVNLAQLALRKVVKKPDFNIFQSLVKGDGCHVLQSSWLAQSLHTVLEWVGVLDDIVACK